MPDIIKSRADSLGPGATERFVDVTGLNEMAQQVVLAGGGAGGALTDAQLRLTAVPVSLAAAPTPTRAFTFDVATGAAAIAKSSAAHATAFLLHNVTVHFSAAPTTSQNLTVTLNVITASAYDTVLCKVNPSVGALTDIAFVPEAPILCAAGDTIDVAFTNTELGTYGVRIVTEGV